MKPCRHASTCGTTAVSKMSLCAASGAEGELVRLVRARARLEFFFAGFLRVTTLAFVGDHRRSRRPTPANKWCVAAGGGGRHRDARAEGSVVLSEASRLARRLGWKMEPAAPAKPSDTALIGAARHFIWPKWRRCSRGADVNEPMTGGSGMAHADACKNGHTAGKVAGCSLRIPT